MDHPRVTATRRGEVQQHAPDAVDRKLVRGAGHRGRDAEKRTWAILRGARGCGSARRARGSTRNDVNFHGRARACGGSSRSREMKLGAILVSFQQHSRAFSGVAEATRSHLATPHARFRDEIRAGSAPPKTFKPT